MNPATNATTFTLVANVTSAPGVPSGSITFFDGTQQLGSSAADSAGRAELTVMNLSSGIHSLSATYNGDANFASSQSTLLKETVVDSHSTVTLTSSVNPQIVTEAVTLIATVSPALGGQASSGTVSFIDGNQSLATIPVTNSTASFTTKTLAVGGHQIVATYQAASSPGPFDGKSPVLAQTINRGLPIIIIGGNGQDFTVKIQQSTAQISASSTFSTQVVLTPVNGLTGTVTTLCAGVPPGSGCTVTADAATFDGKNPITATLVITTTGSTGTSIATLTGPHRRIPYLPQGIALGLGPVALACILLPVFDKKRRKLVALTLLTVFAVGCGGATFEKQPLVANTPPGTYTINVQSQSGTLEHTGHLLLTVK